MKFLPILIFLSAIFLIAFHIMQIQIALSCAVLALLTTNVITIREIYDAIDWPIIILLGAMLPLGLAIQTTGTSAMIANFLLTMTSNASPTLILAIIIITTMTLSDVMNNTATTVIMAPISITIAESLTLNPDTFLMAVAIGASCSFLTPISHQNNALVLGPGGYHFTDYIRLGLPLELLILIVALPILPIVWPLEVISLAPTS
ncbi:MAG: anion permease [Legionellales bacterium]|nr:anion permease [Legionellales bacterium]